MKNPLPRLLLLLALLLPLTPARAAFDPAVVAGEARWVVYVDLNALRTSTLGKELITAAEKAQLESNKAPLGIDIQKLFNTIGTVTAYGANFSTDPSSMDGALVIQGTADLPKIAEAALVQATITTPDRVTDVPGQPFPVYAISPLPPAKDSTKPAPAMQVYVAFPPESVILVSKSQAQLLKARDVVRGKEPSLARNPTSPLAGLLGNAHNAYLFAASLVPSEKLFDVDAPQARILQMARAGSLALGESGPLTFAHVELSASSDAMADKLMKILQGMTAMVSLAETTDKDLAEFMNSATVARNDQAVTLHVAYSSARLSQMIQSLKNSPTATGGVYREAREARDFGKVVSEWKIIQEPADALAWQTIENVHLNNSTLITLSARTTGRVDQRTPASFDRIEISPAQGSGSPLIFRAEYMKIVGGFQVGRKPWPVTGGKLLVAMTPVSIAQLQFPGNDGTYTVRIGFANNRVGENTSISVSIKDPTPPPAQEAKPNDDATKRSAP